MILQKENLFQQKTAFTLAETLITLGIIGVVAALTIPSLVSKYQKHVYYTQFRKAATVLENAINQYNFDHSCGGQCGSSDSWGGCNNLCWFEAESSSDIFAADKLGEYMNVVQWITDDNYEEVCEGYKKRPPAFSYDGTERAVSDTDDLDIYSCKNHVGSIYNKGYGFITNDGMLFNFATDYGVGNGHVVDINGPNNGPNTFGRDMFVFYLSHSVSERWGYPEEEYANCFGSNKEGDNCGIRLLQEGKMNY